MIVLSEREIQSVYTIEDAIRDVEAILREERSGKLQNPERTVLNFPERDASVLYMPCAASSMAAVKVVSIFPHNLKHGKPTTQGVIVVTNTETGEHAALLNATYLTRLRTGAVCAIAAKYLARRDASRLAVIGTGAMAREQVAGMLAVRPITKMFLYNRTKEKAEQFAAYIREAYPEWQGTIHVMDNADEAVRQAHIVICSTRSTTPVFSGTALQPGTHINAIGSYLPHMQELDVETILKADRIVVDTKSGVKHEAGELIQAANTGTWSFEQIDAEVGELVTGEKSGRQHEKEITLFKCVGVASLDLAAAMGVYKKAVENGKGTAISL
ncbi:ornithine cyclodeaminase [Parageobacillus genomosp. 1]|uniref:Ornithine cyclodeaminase n=1 Tax=Parageobacillus genomosp. 1 TaxID=1295642 RepID=A0ABC9VJE0_9BACL|nr:ornithine cyclodeaminase [Parageobacillus genomosp. 1]EZP78869.1 ornithine cyclodeaminase [Parageobacillus genomosp. 1]